MPPEPFRSSDTPACPAASRELALALIPNNLNSALALSAPMSASLQGTVTAQP